MKAVWVLNELKPSGAEVTARIAGSLWSSHGIQVDILSVGQQVGPYAEQLRSAGYRVHHIPLRPFGRFVLDYAGLLRSEGYDVVHVHPERANAYVAGLARALSSAAVLRTVHNVFAFRGPLRWQRCAQRAALRFMGVHHVSVGTSVAASERNRFRNPTTLIFNWYDDTRFVPWDPARRAEARAALGVRPHDFLVVTVGNCSPVKNHATLIQALASLPAEVPWRLVHAGLEDAANGERALAGQLGVADRTTFVGTGEDVAALLNAADCFAMPSLYEGFSIAALEALGCGVPSVLADVEGLRDLREFFPRIAWAAPERDSLAEALQEVLDMPAVERRRVGDRLASIASQRFSARSGVQTYADLYRAMRGQGAPELSRGWGRSPSGRT